jgi:hypothetical protein
MSRIGTEKGGEYRLKLLSNERVPLDEPRASALLQTDHDQYHPRPEGDTADPLRDTAFLFDLCFESTQLEHTLFPRIAEPSDDDEESKQTQYTTGDHYATQGVSPFSQQRCGYYQGVYPDMPRKG